MAQLGQRVRNRVEGRWDVEIMVDQIERIYDGVTTEGFTAQSIHAETVTAES